MDYQALLLREARLAGLGIVEVSRLLRLTADLIASHPAATATALVDKLLTLTDAPRTVRVLAAEYELLRARGRQHALNIAA